MQVYLVGGAVRDKLLGLPIQERDFVVVGATKEDMLAQGFKQVGRDFPVFLHPKTREEYALARKERKVGAGYRGFSCEFGPDVTLEEDLLRRDLTINAIAQDKEGNIIDPFNGFSDITARKLCHVSNAFVEDPVRVLRLARFKARFHHLGFELAPETKNLVYNMVTQGLLKDLVAERVWQEWERSFITPNPEQFICLLRTTGALAELLPEIDALFGVPARKNEHPEIDVGIHTLEVVQRLIAINPSAKNLYSQQLDCRRGANERAEGVYTKYMTESERVCNKAENPSAKSIFAAFMHDVGKAITPKELWPSHQKHDELGELPLINLCARLRVPMVFKKLAQLVVREHLHIHNAWNLDVNIILNVLIKAQVFQQQSLLEPLLQVAEADSTARFKKYYKQRDFWQQCKAACLAIDNILWINSNLSGTEIQTTLKKARINVINKVKQQFIKEKKEKYEE